jgi:hypothetical protein
MTQAAPQPEPIVAGEYARDIRAVRCQKALQPAAMMSCCLCLHPSRYHQGARASI